MCEINQSLESFGLGYGREARYDFRAIQGESDDSDFLLAKKGNRSPFPDGKVRPIGREGVGEATGRQFSLLLESESSCL